MSTLNDFIDPDLTASDVTHSNGYAQSAAGGAVSGAAGSDGLSMDQRRKLLHGRKIVASYTQSQLGQRYGALKARTVGQQRGRAYDASSGKFSDRAGYSIRRGTGRRGGAQPTPQMPQAETPQRRFIEPTIRMHDPYA